MCVRLFAAAQSCWGASAQGSTVQCSDRLRSLAANQQGETDAQAISGRFLQPSCGFSKYVSSICFSQNVFSLGMRLKIQEYFIFAVTGEAMKDNCVAEKVSITWFWFYLGMIYAPVIYIWSFENIFYRQLFMSLKISSFISNTVLIANNIQRVGGCAINNQQHLLQIFSADEVVFVRHQHV